MEKKNLFFFDLYLFQELTLKGLDHRWNVDIFDWFNCRSCFGFTALSFSQKTSPLTIQRDRNNKGKVSDTFGARNKEGVIENRAILQQFVKKIVFILSQEIIFGIKFDWRLDVVKLFGVVVVCSFLVVGELCVCCVYQRSVLFVCVFFVSQEVLFSVIKLFINQLNFFFSVFFEKKINK